ncbi:Six-hairpin glycosidase-like protein [Delphinella strobiligena]|nr:Six-hairpin glycosidase-like protein [Delphinella strobiligena]
MRSDSLPFGVFSLLGIACASNPWQEYILAPKSRNVLPTSVYQTTGNVTYNSTKPGVNETFKLTGGVASVTYDFGQETAGIPTFNFAGFTCGDPNCSTSGLPAFACGSGCQGLGVAYTEAVEYIGLASDNSTLYTHEDGTIYVPITDGSYTVPAKWGRGGFHYLTLSLPAEASYGTSVDISFSNLYFTADPDQGDLQDYSGYFYSSDDLLNRIWYAGVYTVQLCKIPYNSSVDHDWLLNTVSWSQNATTSGGNATFLADGAKRDRNPWSGDLDVGIRSALVSTNQDNLAAVSASLIEMFILQNSTTGLFPWGGSPFGDLFAATGSVSDTYHLWTIAAFAEYVIASGDIAFGEQYWPNITRGIEGTYPFIDNATNLFNCTSSADWGRIGQGGLNTEANAIFYYALQISAKDFSGTTRHRQAISSTPKDGNSAAINFNFTTPARALTIAENLHARLTQYGSPAPELPGTISPFIGSQELRAQFTASPGNATRALSLLRTQWGHMLHTFNTSTFIEGYLTNGTLGYGFYPAGASFISHAHAWSTGPVYSLLNRVVGLATLLDMSPDDGDWIFQPAVYGSGLDFAKGGYTTKDGVFSAEWNVSDCTFVAAFETPEEGEWRGGRAEGTGTGTVYVPTLNWTSVGITVDGVGISTSGAGDGSGFVRIAGVGGGRHVVEVANLE